MDDKKEAAAQPQTPASPGRQEGTSTPSTPGTPSTPSTPSTPTTPLTPSTTPTTTPTNSPSTHTTGGKKYKVVITGDQEGKGYENENSNKMKTVLLLTYANGKFPSEYITKPNDIRRKVLTRKSTNCCCGSVFL